MPTHVLMPALSPTMTEGNLAKWVAKEGDMIEAGDVLCEIETDKATMEVEAVDEGKLAKILVPEGSEGVAVNAPIAVLLEEGEDESDIGAVASAPVAAPAAATPGPVEEEKPVAAAPAPVSAKTGERIFASPLAKRLAADKGVDLSNVKGSGPHGRIVKADIEGAKAGAVPAAAVSVASAPVAASGEAYVDIPNNNIKKVTAKRLQESKQQVPHFYLTVECRIDALMAARKQINDDANGAYKLSVNDFVLKAVAQALKAFPAANVSWGDDAVRQYTHADISVAVSTPNGLITPIVFAAETKGLRQISDEVKDLAGRAREGKLKPHEFQGGTFTVSNLGMYGVKEFDAIINPPQACILAVGAGIQQPVVEKGEIKIATVMNCTLSVDHRAVDGAVGAEFLQIFKRYIENPAAMLV
ncbi:MAG: pyruvate dehydrogenase complex dihydrolipoamide acetyltransferase [Rhodospirillales bacterium]|nr:pyruvate dehydrogenase complex dihydrolipoamide acetyltransferase [Rhodospirillales bacterium]